MEIAPSPGVRSVALISQATGRDDLAPVFAIAPAAQADDDFTSNQQKCRRGMDENDADESDEPDQMVTVPGNDLACGINVIV